MGSGDELTRELQELRRRHAAVVDVLRALSGSGMRLQRILDQIVEVAAGLCRADSCLVYLVDGDSADARQLRPGRGGRRVRARAPRPPGAEQLHRPRRADAQARAHPGRHRRPRLQPRERTDRHLQDASRGSPSCSTASCSGCSAWRARSRGRSTRRDRTDSDLRESIAIAIGNAKLFETVERQRAQLARFVSPEVAALSRPRTEPLLAGHRAYISVVYFDLRGFTAFAETAEPEELSTSSGSITRQRRAGQRARRHGRTFRRRRADGVLQRSTTGPDHELHAARLAVAMRERIGGSRGRWRKRGHELGIGSRHRCRSCDARTNRIRGALRLWGARHRHQSRREAERSGGGRADPVSASGLTARSRGGWRRCPVDELSLKGFARPVRAYELRRILEP